MPEDCDTRFCVDGVCCDGACEAPCEACTAAKKGSGEDGTCGQMPAGALCEEAHCDGDAFAFVDDSFCDPSGACIAPAGVPCLENHPCKFDLCGGKGCEQVTKNDGTSCGAELECFGGECLPRMASGGGGQGGSASGSGGAPGNGGGGGAAAGTTSSPLYPPPDDGGCGCRMGSVAPGGPVALVLAALALLRARRRCQKRS